MRDAAIDVAMGKGNNAALDVRIIRIHSMRTPMLRSAAVLGVAPKEIQ